MLSVLCACAGPYQYYEGTGLHDAAAAEAAGIWEGAEQTRLTLNQDGTALVQRLDGHDFDFDQGWRLSGTGTWELTDRAGGQDVVVTMTTRTGAETREASPAVRGTFAAPLTYTWRFYARRDAHRSLELFFFFGDPDIGNRYLLRHATASSSTAATS
ncbi:hypothetical protein ACIRRH_36520 [Kitasatospora sp. NPDC101235]|uniref:hypothetical protein n=1 Tax=Kitasatospora sp. NPDC101235 TaxID=3364101 RepID=UPI003830AB7F